MIRTLLLWGLWVLSFGTLEGHVLFADGLRVELRNVWRRK